MLLFAGTYTYALDEKNRVVIPVKFREVLNSESVEKLYVVRGDSQLFLIPHPAFVELYEKLKSWNFTNQANQDYVRRFFSDAFDVTPDKQGRIMLRKDMCEEAGITGEVVIIGVLNRMEIWSPEKWKDFRQRTTLQGISANFDVGSRQ
ncbi:MAG: division/cell wall cluster transcriptional repressor MraZ [Candidatus Abyssobacteria bacterium SURF_5]|uniref:Transcriptional regulator MraZ n=1 Tax=Abyssobacteria bacterium (strain SURF_5) TaxID=2093360 RepID=A0A3A4NWJ0_ABYX5|nr:MAG: division/cell wall cluster transcriptional repressor MraZ [Candidatus Abyssubacteria bacterium SURF_5]